MSSCFEIDIFNLDNEQNTDNSILEPQYPIPKSEGYRLTTPLPSSTDDCSVYVVKIFQLSNLKSCSPPNPYVEMKYITQYTIGPERTQRTSFKPSTTQPEWTPPERFMFLSKPPKGKTSLEQIQFNIYSSCVSDRPTLGTMTLSLDGLSDIDLETEYTLPLYSAEDGSLNGAEIKLSLRKMSHKMAMSYKEILVYEYERWQPLLDWGNSYPGHLLPIDPGRWSSIWGNHFEMELSQIAEPVPSGWSLINDFHFEPHSKNEYGWEYAFDFSSADWYPVCFLNAFVRRRIWKKEICDSQNYSTVLNEAIPFPIDECTSLKSFSSSPKSIPVTSPQPSFFKKASSSDSESSGTSLQISRPSLTVLLLSSKMLTTNFFFFSFDESKVQSHDRFTLGIIIPLSSLSIHSQFLQILDCLSIRQVHRDQSFARQMTQLVLKSENRRHPTDDAYFLHFVGNLLIFLDSCIRKEDPEAFSDIERAVLLQSPSPSTFSSTDTELESSSSFHKGGSISSSQNILSQFQPCANDVIPAFVIQVDSHNNQPEPLTPSHRERIQNICLKHGVKHQEWSESFCVDSKIQETTNVWKLIYNVAPSKASSTDTSNNPLRYKYDPLFDCVDEIFH